MPPPTIIGLGEILWDLLPSGPRLGGAPANFAYCSHLLGDRGIAASRIGSDQLGEDIRNVLTRSGVSDEFLQTDRSRPTGTVQVELDSAGQPKFEIMPYVAWDFLEWTAAWKTLAETADAVCFGTLAQRSPQSRSTILNFLDGTPQDSLRVFDVNLRQNFYAIEIIAQSLKRATVVKLNQIEVQQVDRLLALREPDDLSFCRRLIRDFDLRLVCVTRGADGSLLADGKQADEHPGFKVHMEDTIGAGDAFTAALVHGYLLGWSLPELNDSANRLGAWVASHSGAMPPAPADGLERELMKLR